MKKIKTVHFPLFADPETGLQAIDPALLGGEVAIPDEVADALQKPGDWLPYMAVTTSQMEKCQEGTWKSGQVALVSGESITYLGTEVSMAVITFRTKAMTFKPEINAYYDYNSEAFKAVMEKSKVPNSGAACGLEFLIWIPSIGERGTFATLFCYNKSMKREAGAIRAYVGGKAMTGKVIFAKNNKGSWHTLITCPCSTPFGVEIDPEELKKQLDKFKNPQSSQAEFVGNQAAQPSRPR